MMRSTLVMVTLALGCRREAPPAARPRPDPVTAPTAPGHAPPPTAAAGIEPPAPATDFHDTAQYLPRGAVAESWVQSGGVRFAHGEELFQLIDGAGEKYLAYGFRHLARTDYRKPGTDLVVTAEVYDMGSALGAFGQYTMLLSDARDPAAMERRAVAAGAGGFLGTSQLVFWKGQHLVQINLADDAGERDEAALGAIAREVLPALATRIATALPGETTAPAPPAGFPTEALVWGGTTYLANGVFGVERTGSAWVGHYRGAESRRYRVALLPRANAREAQALVALLRGATPASLPGIGDEAFAGTTPQGEVLLARRGNTVVAVADPGVAGLEALPREGKLERLRAIVAALP